MEPIFKTIIPPVTKTAPLQATTPSIGMFFSKLFVYRNKLHFAHLSTNSYAEHKALNEAYDAMLPLMDTLMESVQGIYGIQKIKEVPCDDYPSTVALLEKMYSCIDEYRFLFKESWIQSSLDLFQELFASTLYKLKFLK